jgi:hypothetical protein
MPILGIMASQISGKLWAPAGAYDALASVTVPSGGVASVTFAGIPSTYKHLQIRTLNGNPSTVSLTINSGSFARRHYLYGSGSGSGVAGSDTGNDILAGSDNALIRAANIIDILDYTNTNKTKTYRVLGGVDTNGGGTLIMFSALDLSTTAINTITLTSATGVFREYSSFALYGVK